MSKVAQFQSNVATVKQTSFIVLFSELKTVKHTFFTHLSPMKLVSEKLYNKPSQGFTIINPIRLHVLKEAV